MYVGSVEPVDKAMWILSKQENQFIRQNISFIPALYKIFDEILVNAADNKIRNPEQTKIEVKIGDFIEVYNDGCGIYPEYMNEYKQYVPEFIFGELRAGSNFDDEKRIVGGRNGMGATLCNIYSDFFEVETASRGKYFKMAWENGIPVEGSRKKVEIF